VCQSHRPIGGVDVFGGCGAAIPKRAASGVPGNPWRDALVKDYMFYLAMENSVCVEYASEKFFDVLRSDVVPIVLGGADYERFVSEVELWDWE